MVGFNLIKYTNLKINGNDNKSLVEYGIFGDFEEKGSDFR